MSTENDEDETGANEDETPAPEEGGPITPRTLLQLALEKVEFTKYLLPAGVIPMFIGLGKKWVGDTGSVSFSALAIALLLVAILFFFLNAGTRWIKKSKFLKQHGQLAIVFLLWLATGLVASYAVVAAVAILFCCPQELARDLGRVNCNCVFHTPTPPTPPPSPSPTHSPTPPPPPTQSSTPLPPPTASPTPEIAKYLRVHYVASGIDYRETNRSDGPTGLTEYNGGKPPSSIKLTVTFLDSAGPTRVEPASVISDAARESVYLVRIPQNARMIRVQGVSEAKAVPNNDAKARNFEFTPWVRTTVSLLQGINDPAPRTWTLAFRGPPISTNPYLLQPYGGSTSDEQTPFPLKATEDFSADWQQ